MLGTRAVCLVHLTAIALLLALAGFRLQSPDLHRPFEIDELLTVQYYTWVGVEPSGAPRPLNHIDDYYAVGPPGAVQLAMGVYCGMGRWPEPNNHVVYSLLVSVSTAVGGRDEWWARFPAWLGAVVFMLALSYLCAAVLRWRVAAPLAALWVWFSPYVVMYSQTARGYTWLLALQVLMLILAYHLARRPRSLALGSLGAVAAVLCLMNVVSMAVDWVLPFYIALFFVRPFQSGAGESATEWRRSVLVQALVVAAVGSIFFISHLPALVSSARQYGLPFGTAGQFFEQGYAVFDGLFSTVTAKGLAILGVLGLVALAFSREHRFLAVLVLAVAAVNLVHFVATGKFPYARAACHFVPLALLGAAYLVEWLVAVFETAFAKGLMVGVLALVSLAFAVPSWGLSLEDKVLAEALALAKSAQLPADSASYILMRTGHDHMVSLYGPRQWQRIDTVPPGIQLTVLIFHHSFPTGEDVVERPPSLLTCVYGETRPFPAEGPVPSGAVVFWYPDFRLLVFDAKAQDAYVDGSGCFVVRQFARRQIKFDISSHLHGYFFPAQEGAEPDKVSGVVREGLRRFGGSAVLFIPREAKVVR